jgi:hypothetical protein
MEDQDLEKSLANITLAPYIVKAMALIGVKRGAGSNMFRHQISTMGILLDYALFGVAGTEWVSNHRHV